MLPMIFIMPIFQLLILTQAATFEMKHIKMHLIDNDRSSTSRELINKFQGSPFYEITNISFSEKAGEEEIKKNKADLILQVPKEFEKDFLEYLNNKNRATLDALKAGKLDDSITDVLEQAAKEISAKYN